MSWNSALTAHNPSHWWKHDESSGNLADIGDDGPATLTASGLTYLQPSLAGSGNSIDYGGSGYAVATGSALLGAGDLTFGGWFKVASGGNASQRLAGQFVSAASRWLISLRDATGDLRLQLDGTSIDSTRVGLNDNQGHFWCVTRSGNNWNVYIDGALDSGPTAKTTSPPAADFEISHSTGAQDLSGLADETFIINATALSADAIAALYASASAGTPIFLRPGLGLGIYK